MAQINFARPIVQIVGRRVQDRHFQDARLLAGRHRQLGLVRAQLDLQRIKFGVLFLPREGVVAALRGRRAVIIDVANRLVGGGRPRRTLRN